MFDANGKMRNVADIVEELDRVLGPMSDELKASTLDQLGLNRGVADAVKILSGASDEIREYELALRDAGGSTQLVADNQVKSLAGQIDILKSRFDDLKLTIIETNEDGIMEAIVRTSAFIDTIRAGIPGFRAYIKVLKDNIDTYNLFGGVLRFAVKGNQEIQAELDKTMQNTEEQNREWDKLIFNLQNVNATMGTTEEQFAEQARQYAFNTQASEEYQQALDSEIEKEKELAKEREDKALGSLNKVMSAYKKYMAIFENIEDLQDDLEKQESALNDQKEKEKKANENVQTALDELNRQKELSKQVTLEEELAIIRANEALARAQDELDGTRAKQIEYELALKNLNETKLASTSATNDEISAERDYQRALDEQQRQIEATKKAQEEYRQAKEDLAKATEKNTENMLELAIAKAELDKALADAQAIGALENGLMQMVDIVGGSLEELRKEFEKIFNLAGQKVTLPDGNGNGGGEVYDTSGNVTSDGTSTGGGGQTGKFAFALGQQGGVTTINNIQVAVEGALSDKENIQDAVAVALLQAQKRGTKVIL